MWNYSLIKCYILAGNIKRLPLSRQEAVSGHDQLTRHDQLTGHNQLTGHDQLTGQDQLTDILGSADRLASLLRPHLLQKRRPGSEFLGRRKRRAAV